MAYVAKHKFAPITPSKARLVINMVRGKDVNDALSILKFAPQRAAKMAFDVVRSAQANAENMGVEDVEALYISKIWVDDSIRLKRWRPRSRGMAAPYKRRRSHICVELDVRN